MMIHEELDLTQIKLCPCCVEGLLAKREDCPDRVLYHCELCGTDFTPALFHEITVKDKRVVELEAELDYFRRRDTRESVLILLSCFTAAIIIFLIVFYLDRLI